ncbi:MAG: glycosyltransferase 87 family protein [Terrabacter sp.]
MATPARTRDVPHTPDGSGARTAADPSAQRTPVARRPAAGVATAVAVLVAWVATLPRLVPSTTGDHGTYVSVAERLLAGDRLYVDVWDNKDPFFYYVLALGRLVSPLADVVIEVGWVVLAGMAVVVLARAAGAARGLSLVAGLGATPLLLTGPAYETGMTHLPGLALVLLAVASAVRSRWVLAGVLVGLLLLTKLILTPVAVGSLVVVAVHRRREHGLAGLVRSALAGAATVAVGVGALWARGELAGWLGNFRLNADYADGELAQSQYGSVVGHLLRAFPEDGRGGGAVSVVALAVTLLVIRRSWTRTSLPAATGAGPTGSDGALRPQTISPAVLWDLALVTLGLALVVIAATATWPHHAQSLSVPGGCALALVATRLSQMAVGWRPAALLLLAGYAAAGALHPYFYLTSARGVPSSVRLLQQVSPASALLASLPEVRTYARVGSNDTAAHAVGLGALELACPRFHQYAFIESAAILDATAVCLPRADALIIDSLVQPQPGATAWNAFVAQVRTLVATGYDCSPAAGAEVCVRRAR